MFVKEEVGKKEVGTSSLSSIMAVEEAQRRRRAQADAKLSSLAVFLHVGREGGKVMLSLPANSTMEHIIEAAIESAELPQTSTAAYLLRLTDDDEGNPDTDLPPLEPSQVLRNIGCTDFALCLSNKTVPSLAVPNSGSHRSSVVMAAAESMKEGEVCMTVELPDSTTTTIIVPDHLTVAEFIKRVAAKRDLVADLMDAYLPEISVPVNRGLALRDLSTSELKLAKATLGRRDSIAAASSSSASAQAPEEFNHMFNQFTAIIYKEYAVVKINKVGKRQPRILGIDDKRLTNKIPESERKSGLRSRFGKKTPKRPFRNVDEIIGIEHQDEVADGKAFRISFQGDEHTDYEASTSSAAAEIVAKITYLINMAGGS